MGTYLKYDCRSMQHPSAVPALPFTQIDSLNCEHVHRLHEEDAPDWTLPYRTPSVILFKETQYSQGIVSEL